MKSDVIMAEEQENIEQWKASFEGLTFEQQAEKIRDKILESDELDAKQREFFKDTFAYVMNLYSQGKPLDSNLLRIHYGITQNIEGYPQKIEQFIRTLMLLSLCGFEFSFDGAHGT